MTLSEKTTSSTGIDLLPVDADGIPNPLKGFRHWVCWRGVPKENGKLDKVPFTPEGEHASSTDSRTWRGFDEVVAAYERGGWDGVGFVLSSGDPFVVLDFDACLDAQTGEADPEALELIGRFTNRYVEVSPSGRGLHLVTNGKLRGGSKTAGVEVYGWERFVTVTGRVYDA